MSNAGSNIYSEISGAHTNPVASQESLMDTYKNWLVHAFTWKSHSNFLDEN